MENKALYNQIISVESFEFNCLMNDSNKQPLLFLHGFPDFSCSWRHQLNFFANDYHVIAPDLPGYNLSSKLTSIEDYQILRIVEGLIALIQKLSPHQKVILVGHDWGGILAWTMAHCFPDYFEKLIIINAPHPLLFENILSKEPAQEAASNYIKLFIKNDAEALLKAKDYSFLKEAFLNRCLRKGYFSEKEGVIYENAWTIEGALTGMLNYYRASFSIKDEKLVFHADLPMLTQIEMPVLVLWGEEDKALILKNTEGLEQFFSNIKVKKIPNKGHFLIHEISDEINYTTGNFLRGEI